MPNMYGDLRVKQSEDGVHVVDISQYEQFTTLLSEAHFRDRPEYVFRGHRDPGWKLLPTLYRHFEPRFASARSAEDALAARHDAGIRTAAILRHFIHTLRGTQYITSHHDKLVSLFDTNPHAHIKDVFAFAQTDPNLRATLFDTWALGQHHGLLTPLLDWSESPLVALYFAFEHPDDRVPTPEYRAVYALNRRLIADRCRHPDFELARVAFVNPLTHLNHRLLGQRGLFTYAFDYRPMEEWIAEVFRGERLPVLFRILIPNQDQKECVRWLSRMGINPQSLYPDLIGFAAFSNQQFLDSSIHWEHP